MEKQSERTSGGIGLTGALFLVFLVLKLTDVIDWSWWWVTAPLWIPACVVGGIALIGVLVILAMAVFPKRRTTR